jgi:hypothetical protein
LPPSEGLFNSVSGTTTVPVAHSEWPIDEFTRIRAQHVRP